MSEDIQTTRTIKDTRTNGGTLTPFTHASASTAAQKRWEIARRKVAEAVRDEIKAIAPHVTQPSQAYAYIAAKQAVTLLDSDKPRFDDVKTLGQIMGMVAQVGERAPADTVTASVTIPASVARDLLASMAGRQVIEAEVVEAEEAGEGGGGG